MRTYFTNTKRGFMIFEEAKQGYEKIVVRLSEMRGYL
jgi:hypothetical protein